MQLRVFIATAGLILGLGAAGAAAGSTTELTINCDAATGVNIVYGVDMADRLKAIESHTQIPGPKYYPHESVAFFSGNDYSGYAGKTGRPDNKLTGYTVFAHCRMRTGRRMIGG